MTWRGSTQPLDRLYSCLLYLLPLAGASLFGAYLYVQFPPLIYPFIPFLYLKGFISQGILPGPLGDLSLDFFIWLAIFIFVVRNNKIKHFIRFNAMQALMIDIGMALIERILRLFSLTIASPFNQIREAVGQAAQPGEMGFFFFLFGTIVSTVFLAGSAMAFYSVFQSIRGKYGEIPIISNAAYYYVR
jgi:uncharacterized membrane protein